MSSTIKIKAPAMPKPAATGLGDEYEAFDRDGKSMGMAYENVQYFSAAHLAARDAQWQESMKALVLHLQDAISACNSVSTCLDRRVTRDGCVMYLQTEEWCKWLEDELQPQFRATLSAITEE